jgi:hypothetical protein
VVSGFGVVSVLPPAQPITKAELSSATDIQCFVIVFSLGPEYFKDRAVQKSPST